MNANEQVKVLEHGFSAHSRRPWDCRICKHPAAIHTYASPESQVTWMNANTADVTARMTKYSDRTLTVVRMAAAQGGDLTEHNLTSCGLHATAVKIVKADGIIENTTPGLGGTWSLTAVGRQLCLHFGIEIVTPQAEISTLDASDIAEGICQADFEAKHTAPEYPSVTDADMRDFVIRAITEGGEDIDSHDVSMIVDMLQAEFGTIDLDTVPSRRFWDIVEAGNVIRAAQDGPAIEAIRAAHDAAMAEWVKPLVKAIAPLPVRTPGGSLSAWDMAEAEIWAGTDRVAKMRFPRKMKKSRRKAHLVDLRAPRPIDVKRARIMGGC